MPLRPDNVCVFINRESPSSDVRSLAPRFLCVSASRVGRRTRQPFFVCSLSYAVGFAITKHTFPSSSQRRRSRLTSALSSRLKRRVTWNTHKPNLTARALFLPAKIITNTHTHTHIPMISTIAVNEMLQTAKLFARRGSSLEANVSGVNSKRVNGLTFGEFCVLAADLKRFRTTAAQPPQYSHNHEHSHQQQQQHQHQHQQHNGRDAQTSAAESDTNNGGSRRRSSSSTRSNEQLQPSAISSAAAALAPLCQHANVADDSEPVATAPEVFLGGSCNPTTWRADVAIPALDRLGISFYNPVCWYSVCK